MARQNNFLLGNGERLTERVSVPSGGGPKNPPYTFSTARSEISRRLSVASAQLSAIPEAACPRDQVVAVVTLHPRYIAKSDSPTGLLNAAGLRTVGSRSRMVEPRGWGISKHPEGAVATTALFVAGQKRSFSRWADRLPHWTETETGADQLTRIEDIAAFQAQDKMRSIPGDRTEVWLEVVLHNEHDPSIVRAFEVYAHSVDAEPLMNRRRDVGGLTFVPVHAPVSRVEQLAQFSFLRVVRGMPSLRPLEPLITRGSSGFPVSLPPGGPLDSSLRAAVFDGGLPAGVDLSRWVRTVEPSDIGKPVRAYQQHGLAVTSALLFGPLSRHVALGSPYCSVDHIRVLDERSGANGEDLEILDVLDRIITTLDANPRHYHLVNISIGPDLPVTDDEVTAWTAALDERLARPDCLTTVAVGNTGHLDAAAGLNRVQPPADAVNILSVGACDSEGIDWQRASYSCVGPGRCPGIVKPDGIAFGGSDSEPFYVPGDDASSATAIKGTSFAAPFVLRSAAGVRSYLGTGLIPLAIRALLIHRARGDGRRMGEVGWGRFETELEPLVTCDDDEVIVLFQGQLPVHEHLRAPVPVPDGDLVGMITVAATLLIAPETDPEHPAAYTRCGLEVSFRPHAGKYRRSRDGKKSAHPVTKSFFSRANLYGASEYELRGEGFKWEPCLRGSTRFRADSLYKPVFDVYCHSREAAEVAQAPAPIPYALVVGVRAPAVADLYNRVVRTYANVLIPLRPVIQIPIRTTEQA